MPLLSLLRRPSLLASVALHGALGGIAFGMWKEPVPVSRSAELLGMWSSDATGPADALEVPPPPDVVPTPETIPLSEPVEVLPPPEEDLALPESRDEPSESVDPGPGLPPVGVRRAPRATPSPAVPASSLASAPASAFPAPRAPLSSRPPSAASRAGTRVNRTATDLATNVPPAYPADALRNGWEGTALVEIRTDAMGAVESAALARSSGYPSLDEAALTAVRAWRFAPRLVEGVPAPDWFYKPVVFTLRAAAR